MDKLVPVDLDINKLIERILQKYNAIAPKGISIETSLSRDLPSVSCDEKQLTVVFSNIIENELEAMAENGVLSVRTSVIEEIGNSLSDTGFSDKNANGYVLGNKTAIPLNNKNSVTNNRNQKKPHIRKYVEARFEDTGCGMSEKQLVELFRPFHSTKRGGTGLGLVISKRIIEAHKGRINISSKENVGTVVIVLLPI